MSQNKDVTSDAGVTQATIDPIVMSAADAGISTKKISKAALQVVEQLKNKGYTAELVGGCVRDLLLKLSPKDFDVTTDAKPEAVRQVFRRARLVGRRFRLAHVRIGRETIEVATYRTVPQISDSDEEDSEFNDSGNEDESVADDFDDAQDDLLDGQDVVPIVDDNVYGTRTEDAVRRDFTVNALYYDPQENEVIDYVDGLTDIKDRVLRVIGDPQTRFREDPVRMLRAARFSAKLDFQIEPTACTLIPELAHLITDVPPARLFDELFKLFHHGNASATFDKLLELQLLEALMPKTQAFIDDGNSLTEKLLRLAMKNTDDRVAAGKPVIAAFFFSVALWEAFLLRLDELESYGVEQRIALYDAAEDVIEAQSRRVTIPKRVAIPIREIWHFQYRLEKERATRPWRLVEHKRFRAAYDFYLLRAECADADPKVADWWTRYQDLNRDGRDKMVSELKGAGKGRSGKKTSKTQANATEGNRSKGRKRKRKRKPRTPAGDVDGNVA